MCLFLISHFEFTIEISSIYKELFLVDLILSIFKQNIKESEMQLVLHDITVGIVMVLQHSVKLKSYLRGSL